MGQKRETKSFHRERKIIKLLQENGSMSSEKLSQELNVSRGRIIKDVAELRRQGYPVQTGSMTTENGMYVVTFELPAGYPREAQKNTSAAFAE